ncbi:hypothetical protein [Streptomyces sp. NPDC085540]|uniref:hypothetical protein n=1 Tax=Streptomyces sp. NPDC085540 TaxID=3365730 RepID=UPI0037CE3DFD
MRSRATRRLALAAAATLAGVLVTSCTGVPDPKTGADSERAAVDTYLTALNARDATVLSGLAPPGNDAHAEVAERIGRLGGRELTIGQLDLKHEFGPDVASAHLTARAQDGTTHNENLGLTRTAGRWYITMGQNPAPHKTPAETKRP